MARRLLCLLAVIIMSLWLCYGCGKKHEPLPYNAVIIAEGQTDWNIVPQNNQYFKDDFWKDNMISGVGYVNEHWDSNNPDSEKYKYYPDLPNRRMLIIINLEEYDNVFVNQIDIDFEKEMILVFMTRAVKPSRILIKDIELKEQDLMVKYYIDFISGKRGHKNATSPSRTWIVLKLNKLEFKTVNFI